jgi:hypothetical protein
VSGDDSRPAGSVDGGVDGGADGGHAQETELKDSNPNAGGPERAAGGMGISSERVGPTGPGQESTDGERDTRVPGTSGAPDIDDEATPPEQAPGNPEPNSETVPPVSGYSSKDPRSD